MLWWCIKLCIISYQFEWTGIVLVDFPIHFVHLRVVWQRKPFFTLGKRIPNWFIPNPWTKRIQNLTDIRNTYYVLTIEEKGKPEIIWNSVSNIHIHLNWLLELPNRITINIKTRWETELILLWEVARLSDGTDRQPVINMNMFRQVEVLRNRGKDSPYIALWVYRFDI